MDNNNFSNSINNNTNPQPNTIINPNNNINSSSIPNTNPSLNTNTFNSTNNTNSNINNMNNQNFNTAQNYGPNINQNNATKKPKGKKTGLIILVLLILIGIGGFFVFKHFGTGKTDVDLNSIFDPNKPIIVKNNGKYGYITSEGKTMIEPQYNNVNDFYGDYAVVTVDNPNKDSYNETIYQIIDKKGNVKLSSESYSAPKYYSTYNLWVVDGILYDSKLSKVLGEGITVEYVSNGYFEYTDSLKNESGIMTYKGKKIFTMPGTSVSADISDNEYNKDDLYAAVKTYSDPEKEVIISLKTGDILFTSEDAESYYISEKDSGLFYYYNHKLDDGYKNRKFLFFINNKLAYQTAEVVDEVEVYDYQNQILEIDYGYNYEELGKSQRTYYYDVKNKKMLDKRPSNSTSLDDLEIDLIEQTYGFKEYSSSGRYGIMSGDKVIVPCEYDDIEYLDINLFNYMKLKGKELVLLEKDRKLVLYNIKNSKSITTFNSSYIYDYDDSTFIKISLYEEDGYTTKGYTVYNLLSGKSMDFGKSDDISIGSNYVTIKKDGKKIYYNTNFKQIYVANES